MRGRARKMEESDAVMTLQNPVPASPPTRSLKGDLPWILGMLAVVFLLGLPSILYPFHPDHAMFATIGDRWLHGDLPYRDAWDVKPPGIFALYGLAQALFGRGMAAARWMDLALTMAAAAFLFLIARRHLRPGLAAVAPILFALVYFTAFEFQDSAQSESFGAAFITAYVWMLLKAAETSRKGWLIAAGILLGGAALLKTTFVLFAVLVPLARRSDGLRANLQKCGLVAAGLLLPLILTVGYFAAHGAAGFLGELLAAQRTYGTLPGAEGIAKAVRSTTRFFRERPVMVMLCVLAGAQLVRNLRLRDPRFALWLSWTAVAAAMVAIQWRCHTYHFLALLPPLSLFASFTIGAMWEFGGRDNARARTAALALTTLVLLVPMVFGMRRVGFAVQRATGGMTQKQYWSCFAAPGWYPFDNSAETAAFVRRNTRIGEEVLVFDYDPAIYFLSERTCPTRHLSNEPIIGAVFFPESLRNRWKSEMTREVDANPPRLLVLGTCPHCHGLSDEHTFAPKTVRFGRHRFSLLASITKDRIYRLMDSGPARFSSEIGGAEIRSRMRTTARGE